MILLAACIRVRSNYDIVTQASFVVHGPIVK